MIRNGAISSTTSFNIEIGKGSAADLLTGKCDMVVVTSPTVTSSKDVNDAPF